MESPKDPKEDQVVPGNHLQSEEHVTESPPTGRFGLAPPKEGTSGPGQGFVAGPARPPTTVTPGYPRAAASSAKPEDNKPPLHLHSFVEAVEGDLRGLYGVLLKIEGDMALVSPRDHNKWPPLVNVAVDVLRQSQRTGGR